MGPQKPVVKVNIITGWWLELTVSLPVRGLNRQWCCAITIGFWFEPAVVLCTLQSLRPSPSFLPSRAHSAKEAPFPNSPSIAAAILHQNAQ